MQKLNLSIFLALMLFIAGCKKTNNDMQNAIPDVVPITSQSATKQVAYAEANLKKIGEEIAKLTKDEAFVDFVHDEVRKKFDKEYEVPIELLQRNSNWSAKMNTKNLNEGVAAFKNIGGVGGGNFFPQIYIPTFQYNEDENISNTSNLAIADSIKYVFYGGSNPETASALNINSSSPAYKLNAAGELVYWGMVNEAYANENEVWVFSLNESLDSQGKMMLPEVPCEDPIYNPCTGGGGGGGTGNGGGGSNDPDFDPVESIRSTNPNMGNPTHNVVNFKIQNMVVKEHKENWLAGASDVAIRAVLNTHNNREDGLANPAADKQYKSDQASNFLGKLICKVKRKKIRNQITFNANYTLQTGWPSRYKFSDPVNFDYVIFERDLWPSPINQYDRFFSGRTDLLWAQGGSTNQYEVKFRSANEWGTNSECYSCPYAKGFFSSTTEVLGTYSNLNNFYNSGLFSNNAIGFNTVGF